MFIGEGTELSELKNFQDRVKPGSHIELRVYLFNPLTQEKLQALQSELISAGVPLTAAIEETLEIPSTLRIRWQELPATGSSGIGIAPLLILAAVAGSIALVGALGFSLYRMQTAVMKNIVPLSLIAVGGLILYGIFVPKGPPGPPIEQRIIRTAKEAKELLGR